MTLTQGHGCHIDKQKFACLQDLVRTTQPITTKLISYIHLVKFITWLDFSGILLETLFLPNFLWKIRMCFFKVKHSIMSIGHISGLVGPIDVKRKGGASVGYWVNYVTLTFDLTHDLDLWFFKGWVDGPYSNWGDFRRQRAVDISSFWDVLMMLYRPCCLTSTLSSVITSGFEDLPALISSLPTFKHEKEGKLAGPTRKLVGPTHFLPAEGLGPALNAKTVSWSFIVVVRDLLSLKTTLRGCFFLFLF